MQNEAHILNLYDDIHRGSPVLQTTLGNSGSKFMSGQTVSCTKTEMSTRGLLGG